MRKRAQNFIEIALLACVIVVVSISVYSIYNNKKLEVAKMTHSKINQQAVDLNTASAAKLNEKVPYNGVETAGSMSLKLLGMSMDEFNSSMANITYQQLKDAMTSSDGQDIASLANSLITQLGLTYPEVTADNVTVDTLSTLTGILNAVSDASHSSDPTSQAFIERYQSLLTAANGGK